MNKTLFLIFTPYQLLSAINAVATFEMAEVDFVFVHDNMEQFEQIAATSIDGEIFHEEFLRISRRKRFSKLGKFNLLLDILHMRRAFKKNSQLAGCYGRVFVPSDDIACRVVFYHLRKRNPGLELCLFDDGLGTYTGNVFRKKSFFGHISYGMLLNRDFCRRIASIYCYYPELVRQVGTKRELFSISNKDSTKALLYDFVQKRCSNYVGKKAVFLDQGLEGVTELVDCLEIAGRYFNGEEIIVKKHPRIESGIDYSKFVVSEDGLPFELVLSAFDCKGILLFSGWSTACLSPFYLLEGEQPLVAMLYQLNSDKVPLFEEIDAVVNAINSQFGSESIFLPRSIQDFDDFLSRHSKRVEGIGIIDDHIKENLHS